MEQELRASCGVSRKDSQLLGYSGATVLGMSPQIFLQYLGCYFHKSKLPVRLVERR